jgi:hypothetical protein
MKAAAIEGPTCDRIQQAIAAGEIVAEADHLPSCAACSGVAEAARRAADLRVEGSAPLSPGFRARLMAGGKAKLAMRRRRQWRFTALGAAAAAGVLWIALSSSENRQATTEDLALPVVGPAAGELGEEEAVPDPAEIDALLAPAARWSYVEEPLEPYRQLAESREFVDATDSETGGAP